MKNHKGTVLSSEIFNVLKERIICWKYPPGYRFLEEELCAEFGVSRSPIRETLQMLAENGLVIKEPHRGYMVRQPDMEEINQLYDIRIALESFVVEWLAIHGMPEEVWEELYTFWQQVLLNTPPLLVDFAEKDEAFHETLAECTGNRILLSYLKSVNERLHFIRMTDITNIDRLRVTCDQHLQVLERIKNGDVQGAQQAIRLNIEGGRQKVAQAYMEALSQAFLNYSNSMRDKKGYSPLK
ncbi:MAG: Transcriptional regulator, GntR family [Anaerolineae bacterium]|nr:MAG: Transcriptional regulator, GntR family [Anaerolineae bacterium]